MKNIIFTAVTLLCLFLFASCTETVSVDVTGAQQRLNATTRAIIERFQSYLRIKSVQPTPDYKSAVEFLRGRAEQIGLKFSVIEPVAGKPIVIMEWSSAKTDVSQQSILLSSHMDVVPVDVEKWKYDPFAAHYEESTGNIYARGSQDMKCVGLQYLEAIDVLKNKKLVEPKRRVFIVFVNDEEIGGADGIQQLVASKEFKAMNVGFGLDEGLASETDTYKIYYAERVAIWILVEATGPVGHGSAFVKETATEKVAKLLEKVFEFRRSQEREMQLRKKQAGEVITINLTSMKGGHTKDCGNSFTMNVIPSVAQVGFDIRIPPQVHYKDMEKLIEEWAPASQGYKVTYVQRGKENPISDLNGPFAKVFMNAVQEKL